MIDIRSEELLSLPEACKRIPGRPHLATIYRWITNGVRGVVLESIAIGGKRFTSVEAIGRFVAAQNAPGAVQPPDRTGAAERASRELRDLGA